jgi:hypothetical protein
MRSAGRRQTTFSGRSSPAGRFRPVALRPVVSGRSSPADRFRPVVSGRSAGVGRARPKPDPRAAHCASEPAIQSCVRGPTVTQVPTTVTTVVNGGGWIAKQQRLGGDGTLTLSLSAGPRSPDVRTRDRPSGDSDSRDSDST